MGTKRNQHIVPHPCGWAVRGEKAERVTTVHPTKQEAVDRGREIAKHQGSELVIHDKTGKIQGRDSHGNDPFPPKG